MDRPDFFLASSEGYGMAEPRKCKRLARIASESRNDLLLIEIEPPIVGQRYGLGEKDIDVVVVATRHAGDSLFPIEEWPVFVHVARCLTEVSKAREILMDKDLEEIAWAELYQTEEAARKR